MADPHPPFQRTSLPTPLRPLCQVKSCTRFSFAVPSGRHFSIGIRWRSSSPGYDQQLVPQDPKTRTRTNQRLFFAVNLRSLRQCGIFAFGWQIRNLPLLMLQALLSSLLMTVLAATRTLEFRFYTGILPVFISPSEPPHGPG